MFFFFFKQKTAYEMRISDWSSDVCSSDLLSRLRRLRTLGCRTLRCRRLQHRLGHRCRGGCGFSGRSLDRDLNGPGFDRQEDRKSVVSGKSVSVRVDLGGRRIIKKKTQTLNKQTTVYKEPMTNGQIT